VTNTAGLRRSLAGTAGLAANGGSLILNVVVSGIGGFVFWIVVANNASTQSVAQAAALVSSMLGVLMLSQQAFITNLPPMIAASPDPRRFAARCYAGAAALTALMAGAYVIGGPIVTDGLDYLRDRELAVIFVLGCLVWSAFSLQDSLLSGLRKGHLVLAENTVWGLARLGLVVGIPVVGVTLGVELILATWIVPALVMVGIISWYLFVSPTSPMSEALGDHRFDRRTLRRYLGFEQLTAIANGVATIVLPAVVLTTLDDDLAAPFLAAYQFVIVSEGAIGSFAGAFAVEIRRAGRVARSLVTLTSGFMTVFSVVAVVAAQLFADDFMAMFGSEYREPGGAALRILALGLPFRCVSLLSNATNRVYGAGWKNFVEQALYAVTLFVFLAAVTIDDTEVVARALVVARAVAALVGVAFLWHYVRTRTPLPSSQVPATVASAEMTDTPGAGASQDSSGS